MNKRNYAKLHASADPARFPENLTPRERQIVEALAEHGMRKVVADKLCISFDTVVDHLKVCFAKAGCHSAVVLVARYLKATLKAA